MLYFEIPFVGLNHVTLTQSMQLIFSKAWFGVKTKEDKTFKPTKTYEAL